jgi:hypothetical protein
MYNMGLVYAAMSRPVDAVDALVQVLNNPNKLNRAQLERAHQTLDDQKARIARLSVATVPPEARIEVDGIEVARTPLTAPVRISEGKHVVGAVAEGFAPAMKEVFVAGNSEVSVTFELVSTRGRSPANLMVQTRLPGAQVLVDGKSMGQTPLAASITTEPGRHAIELRRPGYVTAKQTIDVASGATANVALEPVIDATALPRQGATLALELSEAPAELWVDGEREGLYQGPMRLPRGPHHILLSVPGFVPFEEDVSLDSAKASIVHVEFEPTPETRRSYQASARFHRTWGWVGIISGVVVAGGGVALAVVGTSQKHDGQKELDSINAKYDRSEPPCDYLNGFRAEGSSALCNNTISDAQDKIDSGKRLSTIGFVAAGIGGAATITGVVLLLTGNDPNRYENRQRPARASAAPRFSVTAGPGLGTGLLMAF